MWLKCPITSKSLWTVNPRCIVKVAHCESGKLWLHWLLGVKKFAQHLPLLETILACLSLTSPSRPTACSERIEAFGYLIWGKANRFNIEETYSLLLMNKRRPLIVTTFIWNPKVLFAQFKTDHGILKRPKEVILEYSFHQKFSAPTSLNTSTCRRAIRYIHALFKIQLIRSLTHFIHGFFPLHGLWQYMNIFSRLSRVPTQYLISLRSTVLLTLPVP